MNKFFGKFTVYVVLILGAFIFLVPLIWMFSCALKPLDQTMSMPPKWLPLRYYGTIDGEKNPITIAEKYFEPMLVVKTTNDGKTFLIPKNEVKDGAIAQKLAGGKYQIIPITVIREIQSNINSIWVKIVPEREGFFVDSDEQWNVVPASSITNDISFRWKNFYYAVKGMRHFFGYMKNTLVLCFLNCLGTVISSAFVAYGFAKINWRGRDAVFYIVLATMMIPFAVTMVPLYSLFRSMNMVGTLQPLWVCAFFGSAFNIFLLRQFFMTIPKELSDAARIDGCSELKILTSIILPMSKPALLVVALFQFLYTWNDFLAPLIFLTEQKDFTLALGLQFFQSQQTGTQWNYLMAANAIMVIPVIILFIIAQKSFVEGISTTGFKG